MQTSMLIGGEFVPGEGHPEDILNPATGEVVVTLNEASKAQIDLAVSAAASAFGAWSRTTPAERSALLLKLADRIEAETEAFARLESQNCGKPPARALADELPPIIDCFRFFAGAARCMPGSTAGEYVSGYTSMVRRDPVGVVAAIAPCPAPYS